MFINGFIQQYGNKSMKNYKKQQWKDQVEFEVAIDYNYNSKTKIK